MKSLSRFLSFRSGDTLDERAAAKPIDTIGRGLDGYLDRQQAAIDEARAATANFRKMVQAHFDKSGLGKYTSPEYGAVAKFETFGRDNDNFRFFLRWSMATKTPYPAGVTDTTFLKAPHPKLIGYVDVVEVVFGLVYIPDRGDEHDDPEGLEDRPAGTIRTDYAVNTRGVPYEAINTDYSPEKDDVHTEQLMSADTLRATRRHPTLANWSENGHKDIPDWFKENLKSFFLPRT